VVPFIKESVVFDMRKKRQLSEEKMNIETDKLFYICLHIHTFNATCASCHPTGS